MISDAYPLPDNIPEDIKYKIYIMLLGMQSTPSARVFNDELLRYKRHNRSAPKKVKEWNIYAYWGIQCFGRQCEMNSRNSHIYPLDIWCDVRLMMMSYGAHPAIDLITSNEFTKLVRIQRMQFKQRYYRLFAYNTF
jgi:hypothetical protein